jgi:hypothetical protein
MTREKIVEEAENYMKTITCWACAGAGNLYRPTTSYRSLRSGVFDCWVCRGTGRVHKDNKGPTYRGKPEPLIRKI